MCSEHIKVSSGFIKSNTTFATYWNCKKIDPVRGSYATRRMLADVNTNTSEQTLNELIMS